MNADSDVAADFLICVSLRSSAVPLDQETRAQSCVLAAKLGGALFFEISLNRPNPSPVSTSESDQVAAAGRGDRGAQRSLFEQYRDAAYRVAFRITGRDEDALDVVQDSFIRAFEGLAAHRGEASFKTWLLRIVSNRALDALRARKVRLAAPLDRHADEEGGAVVADERRQPAPGADLERLELATRLARALEALPPDQRAVFALFAAGELSYAEIAEAVGIPIGTVMSRLFHARKRLQESLKDLATPNVNTSP
jgi:RNA polymerase sigma-70 factor (ECF subfamily)